MTELNWADLMKDADEAFVAPPATEYTLVVEDTEAKPSTKGNPMIATKFKIANGPHTGHVIWHYFNVIASNPKQLNFFFSDMKKFGMDATFFASNPSMDQIAANLVGKHVTATTKHEEWQGQQQLKIGSIKAGSGAPSPVTGGISVSPTASAIVPNRPATPAPAAPVAPSVPSVPTNKPPLPPV